MVMVTCPGARSSLLESDWSITSLHTTATMTLVIVYSIPRQPLNGSKQYTKTNLLLTYVWPDQFNYFKKSMDFLILFEGSVSLKNN